MLRVAIDKSPFLLFRLQSLPVHSNRLDVQTKIACTNDVDHVDTQETTIKIKMVRELITNNSNRFIRRNTTYFLGDMWTLQKIVKDMHAAPSPNLLLKNREPLHAAN